jgi:hypothetical protein
MVEARLLDSAGRRRSPASMPGYHLGRIPRNKVQRYPADPPRTEEIVAVMRHSGVLDVALASDARVVDLDDRSAVLEADAHAGSRCSCQLAHAESR